MTVGFAHHTMAAKGILYDVFNANVLKNGGTVMLLNIILTQDLKTILMTLGELSTVTFFDAASTFVFRTTMNIYD